MLLEMSQLYSMKGSFLTLLAISQFILLPALAQEVTFETKSRKAPPTRISTGVSYQNWSHEDKSIHELSTLLGVELLILPELRANVGVSRAVAGADGLDEISGLTDVQLGIDYVIDLDESQVIVNLGATLPTGTSQFSETEFELTSQLNLSQYNFRVPYFGQGGSLAPGIAYVSTLSDAVVISLGASYRVRGTFEPITGLAEDYHWGNEWLFTFGAEGHVGKTLTVSGDVTYTQFDDDKVGGAVAFSEGSHVLARMALKKEMKSKEARLIARYRKIMNNRQVADLGLIALGVNVFPDLFNMALHYKFRSTKRISATVIAESIWYDDDVIFEKLQIFGISVAPVITITPAITLPLNVQYKLGDLDGLELGAGLSIVF